MKNWVYIGRFQPFHNGHLDVLHQIIDKMDKNVDTITLVLGSSDSGSPRNPLDSTTRYEMIQSILDNDSYIAMNKVRCRILVDSISDSPTRFAYSLMYSMPHRMLSHRVIWRLSCD